MHIEGVILPRKFEDEHLTLVWMGEPDFVPEKLIRHYTSTCPGPFEALVTDHAYFGDDDDVPVAIVVPNFELMRVRMVLDEFDASEFEFTPHITAPEEKKLRDVGEIVRISYLRLVK